MFYQSSPCFPNPVQSMPAVDPLSLALIFRRRTCDMASGTAWNTVPIWDMRTEVTGNINHPSLYHRHACEASWLEFNFAGTPAVKLYDGSSCRRRMFSFVRKGAIGRPVPATTSQIHRRHIRLMYHAGFTKAGAHYGLLTKATLAAGRTRLRSCGKLRWEKAKSSPIQSTARLSLHADSLFVVLLPFLPFPWSSNTKKRYAW